MANKQSKTKAIWFKQCTFTSKTENGEMVQTAWIPEKFAVEGKTIYFGSKSDSPERLWIVSSVGDQKMSGEYVADHERDYMSQRQASDI